MAAHAGTRVLVVEDDPDDARIIFRALRGTGRFDPVHVRSGSEGLEAAAAGSFGVCLVDYRLPDMSGVEMCRRLRALGVAAPILLLSSVQADEVVARAMAAGANDFLVKHLAFGDRLEQQMEHALGVGA
ncbi:MAG TPA: response regulator [Candidatus Thermoplasmatota archaeon]|nr:response regulator [Candidatus Thermoplasmatota archaeon]